jgi:hypothetical protein
LSNREALAEDLSVGDLERISIEWKSLLSLIAHSPGVVSERWQSLRQSAHALVGESMESGNLPELPELPHRQAERFQAPQSMPFN